MRKVILLAICALFFLGCNMNPSKEARLQQLEMEIQQTMDKINGLEGRVQTLEGINEELKAKVLELEQQ